jgi:hypothetical protein
MPKVGTARRLPRNSCASANKASCGVRGRRPPPAGLPRRTLPPTPRAARGARSPARRRRRCAAAPPAAPRLRPRGEICPRALCAARVAPAAPARARCRPAPRGAARPRSAQRAARAAARPPQRAPRSGGDRFRVGARRLRLPLRKRHVAARTHARTRARTHARTRARTRARALVARPARAARGGRRLPCARAELPRSGHQRPARGCGPGGAWSPLLF